MSTTVTAIDLALNLIKQFEYCSLRAYPSPTCTESSVVYMIGWGYSTYGNGGHVKPGDIITQQQADSLLLQTVGYIERVLKCRLEYWSILTISQQAALIDFAFVHGVDFYGSPSFSTLTDTLRHGMMMLVPAALELYVSGGTSSEQSMRKRRAAEIYLWKLASCGYPRSSQ